MYTKQLGGFLHQIQQSVSSSVGQRRTDLTLILTGMMCTLRVASSPSSYSRFTQAESQSLANALIGVVVIAIVHVQLLSTADSIPHLFDPQH